MPYDTRFGYVPVAGKGETLDFDLIEDDIRVAKRITLKILKSRREPKQKFRPEEFKNDFLKSLKGND